MFNNYKKNKPTTAARTLPNGRQVSDAQSGTNNIYNEGRQSNIDAGQINQYAQIGTSVGAGATNVMGAYQNPESSYTDKYNSTAKAATGVTSAISPVWGAATQATYSIAAPIKNAMESSGENGRKASYIAGHIFDPLSTFATDAGTGTWSPKAYEKQYQAEHNPQGQFAGGGMNMQPNAEVEKQENTLNPDGTATQYDGPSHEQGGIKTNLDPGTLIFSDKVKWDGKTAADHNKPYARIIQKATKDLENSSLTKESKLSAHLNLMAATKASQAIFAKQQETKQSRIDNYIKRLGGIQQFPLGGAVDNTKEVLDRMYFDPSTKKEINIEGFPWGGVKTPKPNFNQSESSYQFGRAKFLSNGQLDKTNPLAKYNAKYLKPEDNTDYSRMNQDLYDEELARMNASSGNGDKSNWFNRNSDNLYQAGFGLAQNAGQLAYLSEQGKRYDKQQYHTYNPELLNDSAAMRDANEQTRRAEYNVRGASAGNAGTYLSNRVALNAQNIENKDRIRQQYANANASIKNRANEVNLANRYSVDDINAKNKGAALTNYYNTIGSVGTNVAQGMKDNRQMGMDNENIQLMSEFYSSPEAQKMFAKYKKEKGIKSKNG